MKQANFSNLLAVSVAALVVGFAASAGADDINPPGYRGGDLSTFQQWGFDSLPEDRPDIFTYHFPDVQGPIGDFDLDTPFPNGAPHPSMGIPDASPLSYETDFMGMGLTGYFNPSAGFEAMGFNIPNWIDTEPIKFLRIQVTYKRAPGTTIEPGTRVFAFPADSVVLVDHVIDTPLTSGLEYFYDDYEIHPNPDWEQVVVDVPPGFFIDQVVVDSISTPIPTAVCMAAPVLVLAGWFGKRRRAAA